jgi:hypothetical protein
VMPPIGFAVWTIILLYVSNILFGEMARVLVLRISGSPPNMV